MKRIKITGRVYQEKVLVKKFQERLKDVEIDYET